MMQQEPVKLTETYVNLNTPTAVKVQTITIMPTISITNVPNNK